VPVRRTIQVFLNNNVATRNYPTLNFSRKITFEYVMLKNVNDSLADARELVRILKGIPSLVNLIPV